MLRTAFAVLISCFFFDAWPAMAANDYPGYGVVQSIKPLKPEPSASAGSSSPGKPARETYLMRIRMDDGRIQVRQVKKREVKIGQRVIVTNAGDVLPE